MADRTGIEWTDATWNPVTGCTEVSPGCDHCYARTFAERWRGVAGHHFERGFDVQSRPERLEQPLRWRRPRRIFVNSMSDLFHAEVPDDYIARVFAVMAATPRHTFQILTKRPGRMRSLLERDDFVNRALDLSQVIVPVPTGARPHGDTWPLPNVWLGVSVEDQRWADIRIPVLADTAAAVRWVSCEPLLGPVDLASPGWLLDEWGPDARDVDWVVAGGESGHGARPMHPEWLRGLRDQCADVKVPFLFKQWGVWRPADTSDPVRRRHLVSFNVLDGDSVSHVWPAEMVRVSKGAAGRVLDGQTWDQFPSPVVGGAG